MADGFEFKIIITGLVVWHPSGDGRTGSFLAVRTGMHGNDRDSGHSGGLGESHSDHPHVATFAYPPSALSGLNNRPVRAPDPLIASSEGWMFGRRVLEDEILWVEPVWVDEGEHLLESEIPNLLSLSTLDSRVKGIDERCRGSDLSGSPAVARLDVGAGQLSEIGSEILAGQWQIREVGEKPSLHHATRCKIADGLELRFAPVWSVTVHSNKKPALRFASDGPVVASYTVEPISDYEPSGDDPLPHFEMAYNVVTWNEERPAHPRKPHPSAESSLWLTIKDRACPPSKD